MAGLEPHHHIIRRAGPAINKHLNLADEQLVSRLISSGCINEKDKGKYSGKTKRARDRFIARFQNQPYALFLTFIECLRGDPKYIELVTALDEALAEYGYVPPTSVIESHETGATHLQEVHVSSHAGQEPSPMQPPTTDLLSRDATTIPPNTSTKDVTLTSTPLIKVAVIPSDIAAEKDPPSDVFQEEPTIVTSDSVTMETISFSDARTLSSEVTTAIVTGATTDSRMKLPRQHAVDDELIAATLTRNTHPSETIDNITKSVNGLSIATKDGDFPRLPFEGDRETMTFTSEGGELFSFVHKFRIVIPPNAVPTGSHATLHVTGYSHGPFQLPNGCKPCSDFIFVEMEGIDSFQLPAEVEMSHNLIMESYTKCREVSICHCEYDRSFITEDPNHQYPIVFKKITEPEVSSNENVFSFKLKTFCGLCAAYDLCPSHRFPYLKDKSKTDCSDDHSLHHSQSGEYPLHHSQDGEHPLHHSQDGGHPLHHSQDGEHPLHHSQDGGHPLHHSQDGKYPLHHSQSGKHPLHHFHSNSIDNRIPSLNSQSLCGSVECKDSPRQSNSRKRKMEGSYSAGSQEKQICRLEYLLLCYWPVPYKDDELSAIVFVCRNCPTSVAACKNQVTTLSGFKTDPKKSLEKYLEFRFDESRRITVEAEVTTADATGWDIHSSTNEIHENDVERLYDQSESLKHLVREFQYPPRVTFDVSYDKTMATSDVIKFTLHCSGIQYTVCSKGCDKRIDLRAKSSMFSNNLFTIKSSLSLSSVDLGFSPHVITTRLLVEVAMEMNKFEIVARHLGFEENQIIRLQEDYDSRHERCYQMLREWWQNSPNQSPATLEELHRVMCFTDQGKCLPKILERNSKYEDIEWLSSTTDISKKSLHYTVKNGTAGNTLLSDVAAKLAGTWRQVGRAIGVDDSELDEIQHDYQKVIEKAYQMLRRWREKYGSSALVSQLAVALLIVGQSKAIPYFKMF